MSCFVRPIFEAPRAVVMTNFVVSFSLLVGIFVHCERWVTKRCYVARSLSFSYLLVSPGEFVCQY